MSQPEIDLVCSPQARGIDTLRLNLRRSMMDAGYLPHWKESYKTNKIPFEVLLIINGKKAWFGTVQKFNELPPGTLTSLFQKNIKSGFRWRKVLKVQASFFSALVIAFFPKCPFCWAAYMSLFSSLGLGKFSYQPWLLPVFIAALFLNILSLYLSHRRHGYKPMILALTGALLITLSRLYWHEQGLIIIGGMCLITASLWNSLSKNMLISLQYYFFILKYKEYGQ